MTYIEEVMQKQKENLRHQFEDNGVIQTYTRRNGGSKHNTELLEIEQFFEESSKELVMAVLEMVEGEVENRRKEVDDPNGTWIAENIDYNEVMDDVLSILSKYKV